MVVHTPVKSEAQRTLEATAAAAAAAASSPSVPPSVQGATGGALPKPTPVTDDLLGSWNIGGQPGLQIQADVHAVERQEHVNDIQSAVHPGLTSDTDADRISVAEDAESIPPPAAQPPPAAHPGLNPFTPEWFAQVIGAAATAAATAVANSPRQSNSPTPNPVGPRRLNDRKVPDFWEDRPEFWFQIFDAHLGHFNPTEKQCFDALLPLLTPAARTTVHSVIRTPGATPYAKAREALLRHFGRTPRQLARELLDIGHARSLGDRLPSEFMDHILGLLPDPRVLFEAMLLDALPATARVAALQHSGSDLRSMASAADAIVLETRAEAEAARPSVNAVSTSLLDSACDESVPPPLSPVLAAVGRDRRSVQKSKPDTSICANHVRFGKETYKCLSPSSCKMSHVLKPKPSSLAAPASGNARAGSRQ